MGKLSAIDSVIQDYFVKLALMYMKFLKNEKNIDLNIKFNKKRLHNDITPTYLKVKINNKRIPENLIEQSPLCLNILSIPI